MEVAFYHKASRSLLVTDAVIFVPDKPPSVVSKEALLDAARNGLAVKVLSAGKEVPDDPIVDNEENRQRGKCFFKLSAAGWSRIFVIVSKFETQPTRG